MSRFFTAAEFRCKDGTPYPAEWLDNRLRALCSQLDILRDAWGGPLVVASGYRTPEYNQRVGGAKLSQHVEGRAADIKPVLVTGRDLADRCFALHRLALRLMEHQQLPLIGGLGLYRGWIHVDVRPRPADGHVARWEGLGVGAEVA